MARLTATLTVLFFLFAFSNGRAPLDRPENNVVERELPKFSTESDAKPTLLLPSQKPESDPTNVVQPQPHTETKQLDIHTGAKGVGIIEDLPAADTESVDAVPLLKRPINRPFPPKRPDHFGHPRRGCHHGTNPALNSQGQRREVSYGDDMILAGESKDFNMGHTATFHGGDERDIPEQRVRFQFDHRHHHDYHHDRHHHDDHHHEGMPRYPFRHHDMPAEQRFRKPFRGEEEEPAEQQVRRPFRREQEEEREEDDGFRSGFRNHRHHHDDHHHEGMPRYPFRHHDMPAEQRFRKPFRGEEEESAEQQVRRPFRREQKEEREEDDGFMSGFRNHRHHHDDHHHEGMPRYPFRHHDMSAEQRFRMPFRGEEEESAQQQVRRPFRREQEEREEDDGFMSYFRKFMNHFN